MKIYLCNVTFNNYVVDENDIINNQVNNDVLIEIFNFIINDQEHDLNIVQLVCRKWCDLVNKLMLPLASRATHQAWISYRDSKTKENLEDTLNSKILISPVIRVSQEEIIFCYGQVMESPWQVNYFDAQLLNISSQSKNKSSFSDIKNKKSKTRTSFASAIKGKSLLRKNRNSLKNMDFAIYMLINTDQLSQSSKDTKNQNYIAVDKLKVVILRPSLSPATQKILNEVGAQINRDIKNLETKIFVKGPLKEPLLN